MAKRDVTQPLFDGNTIIIFSFYLIFLCLCYVVYMKNFFTKKRIAFATILTATLLTMIILLIVPIGSFGNVCLIYYTYDHSFVTFTSGHTVLESLNSPFTIFDNSRILVWQTVVFTLVSIIFVAFATLFTIELVCAGVFNRTPKPTKAERMQAQIDELQKQIDELKNKD